MASSCKEDLDQLLAGLASMGFELDDCQEALLAGHITLESAVEWLVEKKTNPSATTAGRSDKNLQENKEPSGSGIFEQQEIGSADHQVSSRYSLTEEGRKARERFIEKEREVARTEAKKRRLEEKKAKEQILMQIADDREIRKLKSGIKSETVSEKASPAEGTSTSQFSKTTKKECLMCRLQVRLPSSQVKKGNVPVKTKLEQAVTLVCSDSSLRTGEVEILQPFPRRIFTAVELESTLEELGLCPSAMVVVQKKNRHSLATDLSSGTASAHLVEPPEAEQGVAGAEGDGPSSSDRGRVQPGVEVGLERIINDLPNPPGLDIPGIGRNQPRQHQWGEGMRLGAVNYNPHAMEPVLQANSAGESAARRMEMRAQLLQHRLADAAKSPPPEQPHLHREVRSLETICIDNIVLRLAGHPHLQPLTTLGTLPHKVCDKIIHQLMKSKALSPKTMQAFLSCCLRYLKLDCYLLVTNELLTVLRLHKHLTLLSLKSCPLITDKAMEAVSALKKLQSLNLNQCSQLTDKCFTYIKDLPSLTVLQMDNTKVTDQGVCYFVANASCASNLIHLNLCSTDITDLNLDVLKDLKSLKILGLENTKITRLDVLSGLSYLESLNVSHTEVSNNSMASLTGLPCLVSLNILSTAIDDLGLQYLHDLRLTHLKLPGRLNITDQGIQHIQGLPLAALDLSDYINVTDVGVHCISTMYSLTKLTLSNTKLTDVGMLSLSGLTELVELNVDRTAVTDEGCMVISNFPNLQILSLSSTHISNKFLTCGVLNQCLKLSQLNLSRTRVSNKGIRCLNLNCLTSLNLDWTSVTSDCQLLLTGCPALKALRTNNCTPSMDESDEEEV
ncbi:uncharacterized protein LOC116288582 isoform X2 [Actinia tenebrosa]|uniref:Uncharacterized protein LOC116288582 isoform X2 n=1 Tax=Actinia tenebrosa TaxID=6105 RepID=A0A6P8HF93_ACTTE|nr:uncharacterized protein LOC116288582 isoform X2 [Actinia tenebrosa]